MNEKNATNNYTDSINEFLLKQRDGVFVTDRKSKTVLFADTSITDIYVDIIGKKCFEVIAGKETPCRNCNCACEDGKTYSWEMITMKNKSAMYYVRAMPKDDILVCRLTDISNYLQLVDDVVDYTTLLYRQAERRGVTDLLTGLGNRNALAKNMEDKYLLAKRFGVIFFDINNMKTANDTRGHDAGDELIKRTAELISALKTEDSHVYRMGGDEFMLVLPDPHEGETEALFAKWIELSQNTVTETGIVFNIAAGYAIGAENEPLDVTVRKADAEMYRNKSKCKTEASN